MLTKSNAVAFAILALIYDQLSDTESRELQIEPYLNGRENGFAVNFWAGSYSTRHSRKLVFSQIRRSDEIVIYEGRTIDFSMQGNVPSEEIWDTSTQFKPNDVVKAATQ